MTRLLFALHLCHALLCTLASDQLDETLVSGAVSCQDVLEHAYPNLCDIQVQSGTVKVRGLRLAYWRYYDRNAAPEHRNARAPVIMIHGGPAWPHQYLLPMKQQACRGRDAIFYDQVGCGASDRPENIERDAPWLLSIDYYVEELRALTNHLQLEGFHLFGHSWGTIVAMAYSQTSGDERLKSVTLSGPVPDGVSYIEAQWGEEPNGLGSLSSLPLYTQDLLHELEAKKAYQTKLYEKLNVELTSFFTVRTLPEPQCVSDASNAANKEIYVKMQGPSEFSCGGLLVDLNMTSGMQQVVVPVLLSTGVYDTMRPASVKPLYKVLQRGWWAMVPRSGHCSAVDEPRGTNDLVGEFILRTEANDFASFQPWNPFLEDESLRERVRLMSLALSQNDGVPGKADGICMWTASFCVLSFLLGAVCATALPCRKEGVQAREPLLAGESAPLLAGESL